MCCFGEALFAGVMKDKTTIWQILTTGVAVYFYIKNRKLKIWKP